jgi:hypothetical protein
MATVPMITVFGSCRVYDPISAMEQAGRARMNQQNIYGYVHNSREVLQQLEILSGRTDVPSRLRPFLNIRGKWAWHPASTATASRARFARTDAFVVEISSIRLLRFKAMYLQINRTREILVTSPELESKWWTPLLRSGRNDPTAYEAASTAAAEAVHHEVAAGVICSEQSHKSVRDDILAINELLPAPVLFVSHFNTTATGQTIRQRQLIADAMQETSERHGVAWFDPTVLVHAAGLERSLLDPAHYQPEFIPEIGEAMLQRLEALVGERRVTPRRAHDLYEMQRT